MTSRHFSKAVKRAAWDRCGGFCEGCGAKLWPGRFEFDHGLAHGLGGKSDLDNCVVLCAGPGSCHARKTGTRDVPMIAKAERQRDKHLGIKSSARPLRHPTLRRRMDGTLVDRKTGKAVGK